MLPIPWPRLGFLLGLLIRLLPLSAGVSAQAGGSAESRDDLVGMWAQEITFGSIGQQEITVRRRAGSWGARLGDEEVGFTPGGDEVRFGFLGQAGRFRGAIVDGGRAIEGFWIQPGFTGDNRYPGYSSQPLATPLALRRAGGAVWRGTVRPLPNRFTLYLRILRDGEGNVLAAFRNSEQNSHGPRMQFQVSRAGETVRFRAQTDPGEPEVGLDATLLRSPQRLRLYWADLDGEIELARRTPSEAAAFFPRPPVVADAGSPPAPPRYSYRRPPALDDGWRTAAAPEVGIDQVAITHLVQRLIDADPAARRPSLIHSLLVARRGRLFLEEYFFGYDRDTPHDTRSAGKTLASVMLGTAMATGVKIAPETRVYELLAGRGPFANPDPRRARITLAHLMTHTTGFACDDNDDASPGNENTMQSQRTQPDWWKHTLDLPMAHEPGTRYAYCSANMNLVGAALTTATGTWLPEWFDRTVARPLGFGRYYWNLIPNDEGYLGGGAFLRPRDLLKVGQLYLDGGAWRGQRVVEAAWVEQSTAPHVHISPATTGISPEKFGESYGEGDDGYAWHLGSILVGKRSYRSYAATGNGGQVLLVLPEIELVALFTGGNYGQGGIWSRWGGEIVGSGIIPAMRE